MCIRDRYERIRKPAYPVIKSDPEKGVEDLRRYMDEKGETFDIVLFDLPGTLRSEGVVHTCLLYTSQVKKRRNKSENNISK